VTEALRLYEKALIKADDPKYQKGEIEKHNRLCYIGVARSSIKQGDIRRGFNLAKEMTDPSVKK